MSLKIACVGGGPGGLLLAKLVRTALPDAEVTVFERNRPEDTFGFGVVFSDATLQGIHAADPTLREALSADGVRWDDIEVRLKDETWTCGGNGMTAIRRTTLLGHMQQGALEAGVDMRFSTEARLDELDDYDLVVAADGANSRIRQGLAESFRPSVETATAKFIWFGTPYQFTGLTFVHKSGPDGTFAVHGYPIGDGLSTFIVETNEETWRRAGLDAFDVTQPPGVSDEKSKEYLEKLFADQIDGQHLITNNSRWGNFGTRRAGSWVHGNVALLGDAAHTAHFSVGSGTKMAMEDAIALAAAIADHPDDVPAALAAYETAARPPVEKIQGSARPSLSWWEHFGRYHDNLEPWQFSFHFLTRSISAGRLARRDPGYVETIRARWHDQHGASPLETPFSARRIRVAGRVLVQDTDSPTRVLDPSGSALVATDTRGSRPADPWIVVLDAPDDEDGLPDAIARLHQAVAADPHAVAVRGGTPFGRTLLAEEVRWGARVPVARYEPGISHDEAETLILSGRTDLIVTDAALAEAAR